MQQLTDICGKCGKEGHVQFFCKEPAAEGQEADGCADSCRISPYVAILHPISVKGASGEDTGQAFVIKGLSVPSERYKKPVVHVRHGAASLLEKLEPHFEFFICTRAPSFAYVSVIRRILDGTKNSDGFKFLKNFPCLAKLCPNGLKSIKHTMEVAEKLYSTTLAIVLDDNEHGRHYLDGQATWESKATAQIVACTPFQRYRTDDLRQGRRGLDGYNENLMAVARRFYDGIDSICIAYKQSMFCDEGGACPTPRPEASQADVANMLEKVIRGPTLTNLGVSPPNSPRR